MNKQKKEPVKIDETERKKLFSFFMLSFPTFLIVLVGMLFPEIWLAPLALAIYQFILLKQFLDDYYKVIY